MNLLKRIFASPDDSSKIIDGAIKGMDAIVFTKEERAAANAKIGEWYLRYLAATESQNLARRLIAMLVVGLFVVLVLTGVAARMFGSVAISDYVFNVLTDVVLQPFSIVIGFYFLTHAVRAYSKE